MLHAGDGTDSWHARVDLIAPDNDKARVGVAAEALRRQLHGTHAGTGWGAGVDQGIGVEGQPVIGFVFWVRADDLGSAALTALDTARRAGAAANLGPDYYDVSLVPRSSVLVPEDEHEMWMTD
jgi:hypothetical protein